MTPVLTPIVFKPAEQARILNFHAAILNDFKPRITRLLCRFFVHNTQLQPDDFGPYFNCLIDNRRDAFDHAGKDPQYRPVSGYRANRHNISGRGSRGTLD